MSKKHSLPGQPQLPAFVLKQARIDEIRQIRAMPLPHIDAVPVTYRVEIYAIR